MSPHYSLTALAACSKALLRSMLFSVRCACFQFIEIERACIGRPTTSSERRLQSRLGTSTREERFDQRLLHPQKSRGQFVPGMRKGIGVCHCFGDTPIDRSLPRVKRTRHVGYELLRNSSEIGSEARCLSIVDAQAPFAKLWKIYGVGVGQPSDLTDERG